MPGAMALVKRELGTSAVILHTRTFRRGGFLGFGAKPVVEITASTDVRVAPPRLRREARREPPSPPPPPPGAANLLNRTYGGGSGELTSEGATDKAGSAALSVPDARGRSALTSSADSARKSHSAPALPANGAGADPRLNEEVRQIRGMVRRMMKRQATDGGRDLPDKLFDQYLALLEQEVAEELAEQVVGNVRAKLSDEQLGDERALRDAVGKEIANLIPTPPPSHPPTAAPSTADSGTPATPTTQRPRDGRPLTIALIGPTGVGKTTTLAKLAATFKLREKKRVALVTIDTYRIAAVDQLQAYAGIINLPLSVVLTPTELRESLDRLREYDVILIDTAGRSQRDDGKLDQLREFIAIADPHEVHLVLASTCNQPVLMDAVDRFSQVRIDRIIFTKLDEAVSFGVLLNVIRRVGKQLSYVTTGQDVPHQIEPGRSERLAGLILGETL